MDPPLKWDHRIVELPYSRTPSLCTEVISCSLGGKYQKSRIKPYFLTKAKKWTYYILVGSYKHKHGSYLAISSLNIVSNKFYKKPVPPFKFFWIKYHQKNLPEVLRYEKKSFNLWLLRYQYFHDSTCWDGDKIYYNGYNMFLNIAKCFNFFIWWLLKKLSSFCCSFGC